MATPISNVVTNPLGNALASKINLNPLTQPKPPAPAPAPTQPKLSFPNFSQPSSGFNMNTQTSTPPTSFGGTSGLVPTTAVKSISTDGKGGNTTTFHAPPPPPAQTGSTPAPTGGNTTGTPPPPSPTSYPGLVGGAAGAARGALPIGQSAADIAAEYGKKIAEAGQEGANMAAGDLSTGTNVVGEGNAAIASNSASQRMQALASGESAALQGTGQQLTAQGQVTTGLTGLAGLTPDALRYGGAGAGGLDPSTASSQYAQDVISGKRTYDDAVQAMGLYGTAGKQFLDQSIRSAQPSFNFSQAQALGGSQGTIAPGISASQQVLQQWQTAYQNAPWWQTTGVPVVNALGKLFSELTGVGGGGSTALQQTVNDARNTISNALGAAYNTTPTAFTSTVQQMIPDNATPAQVESAMTTLTNLFNIREQVYGQPGNATTQNATSNDIYNF